MDLAATGGGLCFVLGEGGRAFRWSGARLSVGAFSAGLVADFDGDCHVDVAFMSHHRNSSVEPDLLRIGLNRSFDPIAARRGNVNAAAGSIVDVLFVNGTSGAGDARLVTLGQDDPISIFRANAPSRAFSPFVLYKWLFEPTAATTQRLPFGLGLIAAGPPFDLGCSPPHKHVWNNVGKTSILGAPTHASTKAPSEVFTSPGLGRPVTWYLQGFVLDRAALNGKAAVTNGILLRVE
jgi:hypothetical protein